MDLLPFRWCHIFSCSKDYEGLVEVDNSIENIQIKNGMLVFYTYVLYAQPFFLC